MIQDRYLNPFTDFGFKKLFGTEANKDLLIDFLNSLFQISAVQNLSPEEKERYESSLKFYHDTKNVIDTAKEEGRVEGRLEGEQIGIAKGAPACLPC
jgi:predicted transposase YdaD